MLCLYRHSHPVTASKPHFRIALLQCCSQNRPASGCPYRFKRSRTTGLLYLLCQLLGHLSLGRCTQVSAPACSAWVYAPVAYFSAAFSLGLILPMITNSIVKVAFPSITQMTYTSDVDKYLFLIKKAVIPILLGVSVFSLLVAYIVNIFFYEKYG